jgi:hypothetical protein
MSRAALWRSASLIVVGSAATRALWLAWQYYFNGGPRYRVESAMIALVIVGAMVIVLRRADRLVAEPSDGPLSRTWMPFFILASVAVYYRAIGLGLLSDDYTLRAMAQSDNLGSGTGWFFRPIPLLLWRGVLAVADAAAPLHLLNVLFHGLNAFLVATIGRAMGMRREVALGGAALFLTFPILPEAVVWAAGIQDVLMTTMALGVLVLCAPDTASVKRWALMCGLLMLGFGSKETAVCLPVLIAVCWFTPERMRRDAKLYLAIAGVTAIYLAIRLSMGIGSDYLGSPSRYFFKQMIVVAFGTLAAPWRTPTSAFEQWQSFGAVLLTVLLVGHACLTWRRSQSRVHRNVRLALWVLASIAPVFTFFFVGPTLEGSRYLYLGSCAWSLVVADLIAAMSERIGKHRLAFGAAIAATCVVFVASVQREIDVWWQAAELRDDVLANARTAITEAGCDGADFAGVPDSVEGAYVFRNGFPEAVGLAGTPPTGSEAACHFVWTSGRFVKLP